MSKVLTEVFNLWLAAETKREQTRCHAGMVSLLSYTHRCVFIKPFFVSFFSHFFLNLSFRLDSFSL